MNISELAREAGFDPHDMSADFTCNFKDIERFAALVRAAALEEAAGVCDDTLAQHYMKQTIPAHDEAMLLAACADCAAAILALKGQA